MEKFMGVECRRVGARMTGKTAERGKADGNVHGNVQGS